jgi:hypothetical protein
MKIACSEGFKLSCERDLMSRALCYDFNLDLTNFSFVDDVANAT